MGVGLQKPVTFLLRCNAKVVRGLTDSLLTDYQRIRFDGDMELFIPDETTFSMSDLEKANPRLSAVAIRAQFVRAIVEGRVEIVESATGADKPFVYRKCQE